MDLGREMPEDLTCLGLLSRQWPHCILGSRHFRQHWGFRVMGRAGGGMSRAQRPARAGSSTSACGRSCRAAGLLCPPRRGLWENPQTHPIQPQPPSLGALLHVSFQTPRVFSWADSNPEPHRQGEVPSLRWEGVMAPNEHPLCRRACVRLH